MPEIFTWDKRHRFMAFGTFAVQGDEYDDLLESAGIDEMDAEWEALEKLLDYLESGGVIIDDLIIEWLKENFDTFRYEEKMKVSEISNGEDRLFIEVLVEGEEQIYMDDVRYEEKRLNPYGVHLSQIFMSCRRGNDDCHLFQAYVIIQRW